MLRILSLVLLSYTFIACGGSTSTDETAHNHEHHDHDGHDHSEHDHHDHDGHDHSAEEGDGIHFGNNIDAENSISLAEVVNKIDTEEGTEDLDMGEGLIIKAIPTKVEGKVSEVCTSAGCWLIIANDEGKEIFINTNHDFFVPTSILGKTVVVDGSAYKTITSVEERQHAAKTEGLSEEEIKKISTNLEEYTISAKGLVIKS